MIADWLYWLFAHFVLTPKRKFTRLKWNHIFGREKRGLTVLPQNSLIGLLLSARYTLLIISVINWDSDAIKNNSYVIYQRPTVIKNYHCMKKRWTLFVVPRTVLWSVEKTGIWCSNEQIIKRNPYVYTCHVLL